VEIHDEIIHHAPRYEVIECKDPSTVIIQTRLNAFENTFQANAFILHNPTQTLFKTNKTIPIILINPANLLRMAVTTTAIHIITPPFE
jgi:hypothetical protein